MHLKQFFSTFFRRSNSVTTKGNIAITLPGECVFEAYPDIEAVEPDDRRKQRTRRFEMVAYTGAAMTIGKWPHPIVVDLAGLDCGGGMVPILLDHKTDSQHVLGQTAEIRVVNNELIVSGAILGVSAATREAVALADGGFKWQASIGAQIVSGTTEFIPPGRTGTANGKSYPGPCYIARQAVLKEISFVAVGADGQTRARIAAQAFEAWLVEAGWDPTTLSDQQTSTLQRAYRIQGELNRRAAEKAMEIDPAEIKRIATIQELFCGPTNSPADFLLSAKLIRDRTPERDVIRMAFARQGLNR